MKKEKELQFFKLQASGNDFILIQAAGSKLQTTSLNYKKFAKEYCQRKLGVGADGLLVIEPSRKALFKMRIFNSDGSEAEMCGNGVRCAALHAARFGPHLLGRTPKDKKIRIETKAGVVEAEIKQARSQKLHPYTLTGTSGHRQVRSWGEVKIKMPEPFDLRLSFPIKVFGRRIKVNRINTGVPHNVIFVEGLDKINVTEIGREIRFHKAFEPEGTNVDFVEIINDNFIKIRTYERGVEEETLACGTGAVASAIVADFRLQTTDNRLQNTNYRRRIKILTKSGEVLRVYFEKYKDKIEDAWLEGKAYLVYSGQINTDDHR